MSHRKTTTYWHEGTINYMKMSLKVMDYLGRNQSPSLIFLTEKLNRWATEGNVPRKYVPHTHKLLF